MRYALAGASAVAALLLREVLGPAFRTHYPYHTVWLAVVFSAWYCGIGPSIFSITVSIAGIWYLFLPPYHSLLGKSHTEVLGVLSFLAFSAIIVALGESNRRLALKRKKAEEELRRAQTELEERVRQRTAALETMKEAARNLSVRIMNLQDDERRRIARGLHDSLGQYLTALKINLDMFGATGPREAAVAEECNSIVQKCLAETRTISHLLHPPLLDEAGFGSAARWYVDGFAERSGLEVELDLPAKLPRLSRDLELTLFRAVQEALTNVHRHSESSWVQIRLVLDATQVRLTICDNGKGIPAQKLSRILEGGAGAGVGLGGMQERVRELGGSLQIESSGKGTALTITMPRLEPTSVAAEVLFPATEDGLASSEPLPESAA